MLFGEVWLSLGGVLDDMVVSLVVVNALCKIAEICPHRVTENCVYHSRGVRRSRSFFDSHVHPKNAGTHFLSARGNGGMCA